MPRGEFEAPPPLLPPGGEFEAPPPLPPGTVEDDDQYDPWNTGEDELYEARERSLADARKLESWRKGEMLERWRVEGLERSLADARARMAEDDKRMQELNEQTTKLQAELAKKKQDIRRMTAQLWLPEVGRLKKKLAEETSQNAELQVELRGARYQSFVQSGVMDTLQADLPKILHKQPHWDIFANDFELIDQTGQAVSGLENNQKLMRLMRRYRHRFAVKDEIEVVETSTTMDPAEPFNPSVVARWKLKLGGARLPFAIWKKPLDIDIEMETVFHFDSDNKVDSVRITSWNVNGLPHQLSRANWDTAEDPQTLDRKVQEWARTWNRKSRKSRNQDGGGGGDKESPLTSSPELPPTADSWQRDYGFVAEGLHL